MGRINVLDKFTAEKIAAGEVVERPASVIKELVENSIDAGATSVTVEIKQGGGVYMRVSDNGYGMARDDAQTAFLRHATSKIKTSDDLFSVSTLGFRGEALASISAVSHVELFTKQREDSEGTHVSISGGGTPTVESAGCPDGTTIIVKDLFFNTPARLKFMKKDSVEASAVLDVCNKQALSHVDVSIKLIRDGKEVLFSPGDNTLKNSVHAVFGKDVANNMAEVSYAKDGIKVTGLTGKNNLSRPNRLMQVFFINGRYIVNKVISAALTEAYKNELMTGKFPVAVLNIEIDPSLVDVNVHPTKTEVKFASEQAIYETVYWAVKNALSQKASPREVNVINSSKAFEMPIKKDIPIQAQFTTSGKTKFTPLKTEKAVDKPKITINEIREAVKPYEGKLPVRDIERIEPVKETPLKEEIKEEPIVKPEPEAETPQAEIKETPVPEKVEIKDYRIIGQLFSTYILAESDGEFILVDQHAAHERINYEKLKQSGKAQHQLLLVPISLTLTPPEKALCEEHSEFLLDMGFEIEDFGKNAVVLRSLPADCPYENGGDLLIELLQIIAGGEAGEISALRDRAIYTVACKSSIKAHQNLSVKEMDELYKRVFELEGISTCPHGRPISIKLTKYQIEKMFGRIV